MAPRPPEYTASQRALLADVANAHELTSKAELDARRFAKDAMKAAEKAMRAGLLVGDVGTALGMTRSGFLSKRKRAAVQGPAKRKRADSR